MTYKQIEASRELRLWIQQIIIPGVVITIGVLAVYPKLRYEAKQKVNNFKQSIRNKFSKKGEAQ